MLSPFVGRRRELEQLCAKLEVAAAGRGSLVLLAGEPGIGKTRLLLELKDLAERQGHPVLWGSCFEGDWHPPYGPWLEVVRACRQLIEPARFRAEVAPGAAPLIHLLPELRGLLPDAAAPASLSPDEERFRLYDTVAGWLRVAAEDRACLLVLDDLHWADPDSLGLLRYVARTVAQSRLAIVGTYSQPEVHLSRRLPVLDALAALRRETDYERILLRGLAYEDVAEYVAQAVDGGLPDALVQAIHESTQGNPFYTREMLQHLVEAGQIDGTAAVSPTAVRLESLGIPEGVREVIGRRLARLSPETQRLLRVATGFADAFESPEIQAITGLSEDAVLDALDEALSGGLIRVVAESPATYAFAHAIVRHTIYRGLGPDRRARLHRRIAEAIVTVHAGHELDHAAELAAQYQASATLPGAEAGVEFALAAAERARETAAHEQAVTFLRIARELAKAEPAAARAGVLWRLAIAEAEALLLADAGSTADDAVREATTAGAPAVEIAGRLAVVARALKAGGASPVAWRPLVVRGLGLLGAAHQPESGGSAPPTEPEAALTWSRLILVFDPVQPVATGLVNAGAWVGHAPRAVAIARASGGELDYVRTLEPLEWRPRAATDELRLLTDGWQQPRSVIRGRQVVVRDLLYRHGAIREAVAEAQDLLELCRRHGSIAGEADALVHLGAGLASLGELAAAQVVAGEFRELLTRLGPDHSLNIVGPVSLPGVLAYYLDQGWPEVAATALRAAANRQIGRGPLGLVAPSFAVLALGRTGNVPQARRLLDELLAVLRQLVPTTFLFNGDVGFAIDAIWELQLTEHAPAYRQLALDVIQAGVGSSPCHSNELSVARAAALLGEVAEARAYFERAREALDRTGQRPLRAIVDFDEARLLTDRRADAAAALCQSALGQFEALGMPGWSRRAGALRDRLGPDAEPGDDARVYPAGLTAREVQVLALVAGGLLSREIAAELVVSVPTVQRHLANIYAKIGARSRADATAYAFRHKLVEPRQAAQSPARPT